MKNIRRWHLYLGCFFTPMLLFYILTGGYQSLVPNRLKSPADAETLIQKLRVVHVDQVYPSEHEIRKPSSPKLFRGLIAIMTVAATVTIALGLILAFKTSRQQWPVWLSLVLGLLVPILLLWLGQNQGQAHRGGIGVGESLDPKGKTIERPGSQ
jgi:hypothetical protein